MTDSSRISLPPSLNAQWEQPPPPVGPWFTTLLLAYGGLFAWTPFYDGLWVRAIGAASLARLAALAFVALLFCFSLLYLPTAAWGLATRQRLGVVAASTFGTVGSKWITVAGIGLAGILWYAVTLDFALDSTFLGLECLGLLDRSAWSNVDVRGVSIRPVVFLLTGLFWVYIFRTAFRLGMTSVIIALMKCYTTIAILLLTAVAALMLPRFLDFQSADVAAIVSATSTADPSVAGRVVIDRILGFFVIAGLLSVDWGTTARNKSDVIKGGLTGIVAVGTWTACMSLVIVTGAAAGMARNGLTGTEPTGGPIPLSFRWALYHGIGGPVGGAILILFALASLAPACYLADLFLTRLNSPSRQKQSGFRARWGGLAALALVAFGYSRSIASIEFLSGFLFAPVAGAILAGILTDGVRTLRVRSGWNSPGILAVLSGWLVQSVVYSFDPGALPTAIALVPHTLIGFFTAAATYSVASRAGLLTPAIALDPYEAPAPSHGMTQTPD